MYKHIGFNMEHGSMWVAAVEYKIMLYLVVCLLDGSTKQKHRCMVQL